MEKPRQEIVAFVVVLLASCGARTELDVNAIATSPSDASGAHDTSVDAALDSPHDVFVQPEAEAEAGDAGCDWTTPFTTIAQITELSVVGATELRLSQDELTGYFYRNADIYETHRASIASTFATPTVVVEVSSPSFDGDPFLSADSLSLYLNTDRPGALGNTDIFVATRASVTDVFSTPTRVLNVNSTAYDGTPYVTNDGSELWIATDRAGSIDLFRAPKSGAGFGAAQGVPELNSGASDNNPVLTSDGRTIYFSSNRNGPTDIYVAHRDTLSQTFSPLMVVPKINDAQSSNYASWISPDNCRLYMSRGTPSGYEQFVAIRQ